MFILLGSRYLSFVSAEYVNPEIIIAKRESFSLVIALSDLNRLSLKLSSNLGTWSSLASKPSKNQIDLYTGCTRTFCKQSKLKCSYKNPG